MPTPSEQKALAFIAIAVLLGGAVRVLRAGSAPAPTASEQQQVARQARAADSAASAQASAPKGKARRRKPVATDTVPHVVGGVSSVPPSHPHPDLTVKVDMDRATAAEIERLPKIGPTMARRIVANRDSLGPFKSIEALRRVKGMGAKTLAQLAPLVTFSAP